MSDTAPAAGLDPVVDDDVGVPEARPGSRIGLVLAAAIAVIASGGLAWWFAAPDRAADVSAPAPVSAGTPAPQPKIETPAPLGFAPANPDPAQVRRAWDDVRQGYAEGGEAALIQASQACAKGVPVQPQRLDYCLAYDLYAATIAPPAGDPGQGDWFAAAGDRDLALARTALPEGVDPGNRLAQVASLSKAVMPKVKPVRPKAKPVRAARHPPLRPKPAKVRRPHHPAAAQIRRAPVATARPPRAAGGPGPSVDDLLSRVPPGGDPFDPPH